MPHTRRKRRAVIRRRGEAPKRSTLAKQPTFKTTLTSLYLLDPPKRSRVDIGWRTRFDNGKKRRGNGWRSRKLLWPRNGASTWNTLGSTCKPLDEKPLRLKMTLFTLARHEEQRPSQHPTMCDMLPLGSAMKTPLEDPRRAKSREDLQKPHQLELGISRVRAAAGDLQLWLPKILTLSNLLLHHRSQGNQLFKHVHQRHQTLLHSLVHEKSPAVQGRKTTLEMMLSLLFHEHILSHREIGKVTEAEKGEAG